MRLSQGDYGRETVYEADPIDVAASFAASGAEWIHIVDLDAAKSGDLVNRELVAEIARKVPVPIEYGGGVRSLDAAQSMLDSGVARVVVGTKLVQDRALAALLFSKLGERVVAGVDSRDGMVSIAGWTEDSALEVIAFMLQMVEIGAARFVLTDISRDGMLVGPNLDLLACAISAVRRPIVQSGGIATLENVAAVRRAGAEGVIIGKAIYEGNLSVQDAVSVGRVDDGLY